MKIQKNAEMVRERERLVKEKEELLKRVEILASNIALLNKFCGNGSREPVPRLKDAVEQAMEGLKRFTAREIAENVRQRSPGMDFSDKSVVKPIQDAIKRGKVKCVQKNQGSKTQAVYEWVAT